jgi:stage V sporulation protein R
MIFYHVIGHIDFFQNNIYFRHTWDYDLAGKALADKRLIARLRSEHGRWVDYVIEFARGIDNLVGYHEELGDHYRPDSGCSKRLDFYFDSFLQSGKNISVSDYIKQIDEFNTQVRRHGKLGEKIFFSSVQKKYPEFDAAYDKHLRDKEPKSPDLLQFLINHSPFLNRDENKWMKTVLEIIRTTSLYFQPQIRTKIMNEGWASYWHETLFLRDDRIDGHEVDFARINATVTAMPRVGLNPYALGMRLFYWIEQQADRGCFSLDYDRLRQIDQRRDFNRKTATGRDYIFDIRENNCDFTFVNSFVNQDFIDANDLFVANRRLNRQRMVWEYFIQSRKAGDYRKMLFESLYHPPKVEIVAEKSDDGCLYLNHVNEGKPLVKDYIANTMMGIEYLWGGKVKLETSDATVSTTEESDEGDQSYTIVWKRVLYTMEDRQLSVEAL